MYVDGSDSLFFVKRVKRRPSNKSEVVLIFSYFLNIFQAEMLFLFSLQDALEESSSSEDEDI